MSQLQTKQNTITYIANFINYITVNFHNFNTGMIPTQKEQEYKNHKYEDGMRPQDFPVTYNYTGLQIMGLYLLLENERSFPG